MLDLASLLCIIYWIPPLVLLLLYLYYITSSLPSSSTSSYSSSPPPLSSTHHPSLNHNNNNREKRERGEKMIVDIAPLLTDPRVNLTHPSQLLTVLDTLRRPIFILFCPSSSDTSHPDPRANWGGNRLNVYDQVNREFAKGPTPRYLAVVEVGGKEQWKSPLHPLKHAYKLTTCPTLLRLQLHTSKPTASAPAHETTILTSQFTSFTLNNKKNIHALRFFKKCDISHLPSSHDRHEMSVYEYNMLTPGGWDGWRVRHDIASFMHNKAVKQVVAEEKWKAGWVRQFSSSASYTTTTAAAATKRIEEGKKPRYEVPKGGLDGSVLESDGGGRRLLRVETVFSEDIEEGEEAVVGRVEEMESLDDNFKRKDRREEIEESVLEEGVERVDFATRIEMLESVVDPAEVAYLKWRR
ncbi:hypothetical protein TWF730_006970 [Orbilia blumenaviensis]|uniref:Uncharacterized protein n=1 Tax=Orbilia blumenaviensis TaxID=1796055 RepID=A0AAV9VIF0_9PEZI